MAGRNNNKLTKVNPLIHIQTEFNLAANNATTYVDVAECLSMINRKLFSSEYCYGIKSIRAVPSTVSMITADTYEVSVITAGDTWSVHNAWTKSKALHSEMQQLVLEDNPSIRGTWSDFKVFMDTDHVTIANAQPRDSSSNLVLPGEWTYSQFVLPQHAVDVASGDPLPADECTGHLVGPNIGAAGSYVSVGLVEAYALSRASVQNNSPAVPAGFADSFFNLLTDSGSQEPELATIVETEGDHPPYDDTRYPGGATNATAAWLTAQQLITPDSPNLDIGPFHAQCGILRIDVEAFLGAIPAATSPSLSIVIELQRGAYKGVSAIPMGQ